MSLRKKHHGKMNLYTGNQYFSFFHDIFYPNLLACWKGTINKQYSIMYMIATTLNSLQNNKFFDWSKFKALTDDKINVA